VFDPDPLSQTIRLRGWHIQGIGHGTAGERPLVVLLHGGQHNPFATGGPTGAQNRGYRDLACEAALAGFDVLMFCRRGAGVSEGESPANSPEAAEDVLRALEQLEAGCRTLGPEPGAASNDEPLLASARATPVVLWGFSRGGLDIQRAMTVNLAEDRGFNLRGAVLMGSAVGSLYYRSSITPLTLLSKGPEVALYGGHDYVPPETLDYLPAWPGVLVVHGTDDISYSLRGAVEVFNRARGLKRMFTYAGPHQGALLPDLVPEVARRAVSFSRAVLGAEVTTSDGPSTDVDTEVCKALERALD
jgi:hypothetical protein